MSQQDRRLGATGPGNEKIARLSDHEVELPEGVSVTEWALERKTVQNPRIRSLLGCVRSLETVFDSNYAILHCSPKRLQEIWNTVRSIAALIDKEVSPLFLKRSCIPIVESDRRKTAMALDLIESTVLRDLAEFPPRSEKEQMRRLRKLLCVSIGKLHSFLQDALARTLASDPRSRFDADYFLSRRFPNDVEEAEWLLASVEDLEQRLTSVQEERTALIPEICRRTADSPVPLDSEIWIRAIGFLDSLESDLVPDLREVLSLRGIRFDEMEALERHARELPLLANLVREVGRHNQEILGALAESRTSDPIAGAGSISETSAVVQRSTNRRLAGLMTSLDERLRDLEAFVPFWLQEICRRRALMLTAPHRPSPGDGDAGDGNGSLGEATGR